MRSCSIAALGFSVASLVALAAVDCSRFGRAPGRAAVDALSPTTERPSDSVATSDGELRILPLHHGTVAFEWKGKTLLVDPFLEATYRGLPRADVVFITDIHPDHLDLEALARVRKPETVVVAPPAVAERLPKEIASVVVMKNGDKQLVGGVGVEAVPMYNLTRGPTPGALFHDKGRGDGFVLTFADKRVYVSGDTECTPEMKALPAIDVAFVCMNLPYTMPPSEAATCIKAFRPKVVYPYHFRGSDLSELSSALKSEAGIEVRERSWY